MMKKLTLDEVLGATTGVCALGCGFNGLLLGGHICVDCKEDMDEEVEWDDE